MAEKKEKRALIEYTRVDLKGVEHQLVRLADGLEMLLRLQFGYSLTPPRVDTSGEEPEAAYSTDEDAAERELKDSLRRERGETVEEEVG